MFIQFQMKPKEGKQQIIKSTLFKLCMVVEINTDYLFFI